MRTDGYNGSNITAYETFQLRDGQWVKSNEPAPKRPAKLELVVPPKPIAPPKPIVIAEPVISAVEKSGRIKKAKKPKEPKKPRVAMSITIDGVTKTVVEWSKGRDISCHAIRLRYRQGVRGNALLSPRHSHEIPRKLRKGAPIAEIDGVVKCIAQWARDYNVPVPTVRYRFHAGVRGRDLVRPAYSPRDKPAE